VVTRRERKCPILTPSSLPCLRGMPTINITEGCIHGCVYCYTQGYSGYPGAGRIVLFDNIPELIRMELPRKRNCPRRVYFSPSSDAFQPLSEVQDVTFETMSLLLNKNIEVAFLTKGILEDRFFTLFAQSSARVFVQIGITTLSRRIWRILEPGTASPVRRLETIARLREIGVVTRARLDPLIPDITDTSENLVPLLEYLSSQGIQNIAVSYIFLRPAIKNCFVKALHIVSGLPYSISAWPWHQHADGVGGGYMIDLEERKQRLERLVSLAARYDIQVHICSCKNPDVPAGGNCQIAGPLLSKDLEKGMLFQVSEFNEIM
jgi:DNA repair photolyase